jgi:alcohol dehydrogenase
VSAATPLFASSDGRFCGTDLDILKGGVPSVTPGRILGHEGVGEIEATDSSVSSFYAGDLVLILALALRGTA